MQKKKYAEVKDWLRTGTLDPRTGQDSMGQGHTNLLTQKMAHK